MKVIAAVIAFAALAAAVPQDSASTTSVALTTGSSGNTTSMPTGPYGNSSSPLTSKSATSTGTMTAAASSSKAAAVPSGSSGAAGADVPTTLIGGSLVGIFGLIGMLAL